MAADEPPAPAKWEGTATAQLRASTAEGVWPLIEDFFGIHKWLPSVDTCHKVDQEEVGILVRHCSSGGGDVKWWCHERLLSSDPVAMSLTYQVLDSNMGLKAYQATMRVVPIPINGGGGCNIEWSFLADAVEGWTQDGLVAYLDASLQEMASNMEKALLSSSTPTPQV